jgi:hypothetical protein
MPCEAVAHFSQVVRVCVRSSRSGRGVVVEIEGGIPGGGGGAPGKIEKNGQRHRIFMRRHWLRDGVGLWTRLWAKGARGRRDRGPFVGVKSENKIKLKTN